MFHPIKCPSHLRFVVCRLVCEDLNGSKMEEKCFDPLIVETTTPGSAVSSVSSRCWGMNPCSFGGENVGSSPNSGWIPSLGVLLRFHKRFEIAPVQTLKLFLFHGLPC